jgi:membrane protease YdiL (CAAX protease family)
MSKNTKGIIVFLLIAFGIAWLNLLVLWLVGLGSPEDAELAQPDPLLIVLALPFSFSPAISAFVVRKWVTHEGFADAGLKLRLRTGWPYYLYALLFPIVVVPIAVALWAVVKTAQPDLSALSLESVLPLLVMALVMTLFYFGEEFGWRGYLQVRLAPERPLVAAVWTGLIWGVWHYPFILLGFSGYEHKVALLIHPINSVFISIFLGWLRVRSRSVWPAFLAHAVDNSINSGMLGLLMPSVLPIVAWGGYGMAGFAVLSLLVNTLGQFGARKPQASEEVAA